MNVKTNTFSYSIFMFCYSIAFISINSNPILQNSCYDNLTIIPIGKIQTILPIIPFRIKTTNMPLDVIILLKPFPHTHGIQFAKYSNMCYIRFANALWLASNRKIITVNRKPVPLMYFFTETFPFKCFHHLSVERNTKFSFLSLI